MKAYYGRSMLSRGEDDEEQYKSMLCLIAHCKGKVDICKITTNGFWGNDAPRYFKEMENYYRNAKGMENEALPVVGHKVTDYMSRPVRCFEHTVGKYVLPRMLISLYKGQR